MSAEFQVPSPLVPTRESLFVRYCKQHIDGTWAVVDVSLDSLRPNLVLRCRRRPSGCLIQEMPNGYSKHFSKNKEMYKGKKVFAENEYKVTWVEHVEVDDRSVHNIYKPLVNSGLAFGAKRWVSTLDRQCERLASVMASNIPAGDGGAISTRTCYRVPFQKVFLALRCNKYMYFLTRTTLLERFQPQLDLSNRSRFCGSIGIL